MLGVLALVVVGLAMTAAMQSSTAAIALVLFPVTIPLLVRASKSVDGATLLAGYHTANNVIAVAVLLPFVDRFTRFVERIFPERASPLTRCLDPAALATPLAVEEAVRRTVGRSLASTCGSIADALTAGKSVVSVGNAADGLSRARVSSPRPVDHQSRRASKRD